MTGIVADLRFMPVAKAKPSAFIRVKTEPLDLDEDVDGQHHHHHHAGNKDGAKKKANVDTLMDAAISPDAKLYLLMNQPESSIGAMIWAFFMAGLILLFIICMFVKSLANPSVGSLTKQEQKVWRVLDCLFAIFFLGDYVLRFAVCETMGTKTRWQFVCTPVNVCDILLGRLRVALCGVRNNGYQDAMAICVHARECLRYSSWATTCCALRCAKQWVPRRDGNLCA